MTTQPPGEANGDDTLGGGTGPDHPPLGGRYEVGDLIGRGGMADVRAGHDARLGRTVAIKRLRTDFASDPTFQARFRREAQAAASLNHPAIVAVYDTGDEVEPGGSRVPYIVMEHVDGKTLREIMREGRKILPERALELTADVLSALDYSHRAGIVHRDIKPANVMLTPPGRVKVMDFGIARAIADSSSTMTATAAVVGTAQYLSPEQARGEQVDARSDIYSTGCLLFELLTGRPPFVGDSPVSVAYQHVREEPPAPSSIEAEVPPEIDAIVAKALAKKTADRYQSAAQMRADIERALAGQDVEAPLAVGALGAATTVLPGEAEQTSVFGTATDDPDDDGEDRRRRPWLWVLLGLLLLALIGGAAYLLTSGGGEDSGTLVPDVLGEREADATAELEDAGFEVESVPEPSDDDRGTVLGTDPEAGVSAEDGSTVILAVSGGPESVTVPRGLVGASEDDAVAALDEVGLRDRVVPEPSSAPEDEVVAVDPESGSEVSPDRVVELAVSEGPILVPGVVGATQDDAEATIQEAGLEPLVTTDQDADAEAGIVVDQDPAADSPAAPDDQVVIVVSDPPEVITTTPPETTTEETTTEETTEETTTEDPTTEEPTTEEPTTEEPTTEETTTEETTTEEPTTEETTTEETTTREPPRTGPPTGTPPPGEASATQPRRTP